MAEINFQSVEMVQAEGRGALAALSMGLAHGDACPPGQEAPPSSTVPHSVSSTERPLVNRATDKHGNKISLFLMAVVYFFNLWLPFFPVLLYIWFW